MENLNTYLTNSSLSASGVRVQLYFRNLESHLIWHIERADVVVGCVAWLTSPRILAALAKKSGVSIIVQKEDWLRPDLGDRGNWKLSQKHRYARLPSRLTRFDEGLSGTGLSDLSYCSDPTIDAVRCVGNHNSMRLPAFPRMHHKFIVFCQNVQSITGHPNYEPYEVWTGSFNFTKNGAFSLENAVVLRHKTLAKAFFSEYAQIAALSEPLNWDSEWMEPQWRVGS